MCVCVCVAVDLETTCWHLLGDTGRCCVYVCVCDMCVCFDVNLEIDSSHFLCDTRRCCLCVCVCVWIDPGEVYPDVC